MPAARRRANYCVIPVGGNAVSAFLSWRLQATNACDVTLVWKAGYDTVAQYGISIKSQTLGNERFKPYNVVRSPEEAAQQNRAPFDYVVLCVKALPDVYDLAQIISSVVTPQHTCILLNTTNSIGIEEHLEERYPTNVILSLVCGADLLQTGQAEFEHKCSSTSMWVGWANKNNQIPESIQRDMAEALAMTLSTAQVECLVSLNIRQQQLEKMIGPIAFHPASVLFNQPNLSTLYSQAGVSTMIDGTIDELLELSKALGCIFSSDTKTKVIESSKLSHSDDNGCVMYKDFQGRRPLEIETFLGAPLKLAKTANISLPRLEVIYALLNDKNQKNLKGEAPSSPGSNTLLPPRSSSMPMSMPMPNGPNSRPHLNGGPKTSMGIKGHGMPMARRGPYMNGFRNGSMTNGFSHSNRRDSVEGDGLEEFSHVMLYENINANDGGFQDGSSGSFGEPSGSGTPSNTELALKERELRLRQREIELKERELASRRGGGPSRRFPKQMNGMFDEDEDDEDDYFDPMTGGAPTMGPVDDNIDMLSITSRRHRKAPSINQHQPPVSRGRGGFMPPRKNRSSARMMNDLPSAHESIRNNPLLGYSSNRYGAVDRSTLETESRNNSMTGQNGPYPGIGMRRMSQSPGNTLNAGPGPVNKTSPPNGIVNGMRTGPPMHGGGPYPPRTNGMQRMGGPQAIEQHVGVSTLYPPKSHQVHNLTGSAIVSGQSGDSANTGSANSAASSSSSLQPRPLLQTVIIPS